MEIIMYIRYSGNKRTIYTKYTKNEFMSNDSGSNIDLIASKFLVEVDFG